MPLAPLPQVAPPNLNVIASSAAMDALLETLRQGINTAEAGLDARVDTLEATDVTSNTRLTNLESYDSALNARLNLIEALSKVTAINPKDYGAIGDGTTHTVSSGDVTAHGVGTKFPWVGTYTLGVDTLDFIGWQEALYAAFYNGTLTPNNTNYKLNKRIFSDAGRFILNRALNVVNMRAGLIEGAGKLNTELVANFAGPVLQTDGFWFMTVRNMSFTSAVSYGFGTVELDGNIDHSYTNIGVQGNFFENCGFYAGPYNARNCVNIVRQGQGFGQGSENIFIDCHFSGANGYCLAQYGANALANKIIGGDMQAYKTGGVSAIGTVHVDGTSFECLNTWTQIQNDGYDLDLNGGGYEEKCQINHCRSEGLRFCRNSGSQAVVINGFSHVPSIANRNVATYVLNDLVVGITAAGNAKLYRVTTAGTTSGAAPTWPESGTVNDGTVVWTQTEFQVVNLSGGLVQFSNIALGQITADDFTKFSYVSFHRKDIAFAGGTFVADGANPEMEMCFYNPWGGGARALLGALGNSGVAMAKYYHNIAGNAIASIVGTGGGTQRPIHISRGHSNFNYDILNWWDVVGPIRQVGMTFADVTTQGTAANGMLAGTLVYVTDGTPGDPLTGAGTGCYAYFANNRWKGI